MSKLQEIEQKLVSINDAVFQDLCDSYLYLTERNCTSINRTGSKKGKQKTKKGTPDSYFKTNDGRYVFIEYTTQARAKNPKSFLKKLKDDIFKCLNEKETGIKTIQLAKIIYCCNSEVLPNEDKELSQICVEQGVGLQIVSIDTLAMALLGRCQYLAKEFLKISIDTGQILNINTFIQEYEATGYATKLSNVFLFRQNEIDQIVKSIGTSQISILTGPPGVGKSKLIIESIKKLQAEGIYTIYCITNKGEVLHDDLRTYLAEDKPYILFIDDANRQSSHISTILGILKEKRNHKIQVLITVREYALQPLLDATKEFKPNVVPIGKMTDEEIKGILVSSDFQINYSEYQNRIIEIADGNPRLAIMAAKVVKEKQTLDALRDVSEIYDHYFESSLPNSDVLTNISYLKTLGIVSFFYTLNLENKELVTKACNDFSIDERDFKESLAQLERFELVENSSDYSVVKIAEQVLGTYFFYTTFLKKKTLDFNILLSQYFDSHSSRIKDTVIPVNNTFGYNNTAELLKPYLSAFWKEIRLNEDTALKYLDLFWFYKPEDTIAFVYDKVTSLPDVGKQIFIFDEEKVKNYYSYTKDSYLELLSKFYYHSTDYLGDAIEVSIEYVKKNVGLYSQMVKKLKDAFIPNYQDQGYRYYRQNELLRVIKDEASKGSDIHIALFYDVIPEFLDTVYRVFTDGRKRNEISFYNYTLPFNEDVKMFRASIWNFFIQQFHKNHNRSIEFLLAYQKSEFEYNKKIYTYDLKFLLEIFHKKFKKNKFSHAFIVQETIRWCSRMDIRNNLFTSLRKDYYNESYRIYTLLSQDILRDKFEHEYDNLDYLDYEKLKEKEIRENFKFDNLRQFVAFYKIYVEVEAWKDRHHSSFLNSLDIVLHHNEVVKKGSGYKFLMHILKTGNQSGYIPYRIIDQLLLNCTTVMKNSFFATLSKYNYSCKDYWLVRYFAYLPQNQISQLEVDRLIKVFREMESRIYIDFSLFEKYSRLNSNFYLLLLKAIVERNSEESGKILLFHDFFEKWTNYFSKNIDLIKKAYLQQDKLERNFDHDYKDFIEISRFDKKFPNQYLNYLLKVDKIPSYNELSGISAIWKLDNTEEILPEVLNTLASPRFAIFRDEYCDAFFKGLNPNNAERAYAFLKNYLINNIKETPKVNMVLDTVRHVFKTKFEDFLLYYLSLNIGFDDFKQLKWVESHYSGNGDTIFADIKRSQYELVLEILNKVKYKKYLFAKHKAHIIGYIELEKLRGIDERKRKFLEKDWY